ncbi:antibiotic biosynthesis monooxygenase family protein [Embleya sp. NPDC127516]|uniref:antibiotic biosynthesis monooxygenase family protein n=1 Tax=Embleya sp. NPDC127516 TaxID=3363990 RepID=UPI0038190F21
MAILSTVLSGEDSENYTRSEARMLELAEKQPGYLGRESARTADGRDLTLVYYADEESLKAWRDNAEHRHAQRLGRERWYASYEVRVARVERSYRFEAPAPAPAPPAAPAPTPGTVARPARSSGGEAEADRPGAGRPNGTS